MAPVEKSKPSVEHSDWSFPSVPWWLGGRASFPASTSSRILDRVVRMVIGRQSIHKVRVPRNHRESVVGTLTTWCDTYSGHLHQPPRFLADHTRVYVLAYPSPSHFRDIRSVHPYVTTLGRRTVVSHKSQLWSVHHCKNVVLRCSNSKRRIRMGPNPRFIWVVLKRQSWHQMSHRFGPSAR